MQAFESQTPEALLKEVAEFLRYEALKRSVNVTILDRKARLTRAEKDKRAREESASNALRAAADDLEGAGILPADSEEEEDNSPEYLAYCAKMEANLPRHHEGACEPILILDEEHCRKCIEHSGKTVQQVHARIMGDHINN